MSAASRLSDLRAAESSPTGRGPLLDAWADAVRAGTIAGAELADVAVLLLQTLTEADGSLDRTPTPSAGPSRG